MDFLRKVQEVSITKYQMPIGDRVNEMAAVWIKRRINT